MDCSYPVSPPTGTAAMAVLPDDRRELPPATSMQNLNHPREPPDRIDDDLGPQIVGPASAYCFGRFNTTF